MNKTAKLRYGMALLAAVLLASVVAAAANGSEPEKMYLDETNYSFNDSQSRAVCGDGVCASFEYGVCPADCGGPGPVSVEDGQNNGSTVEHNGITSSDGLSTIILFSGAGTVVLLLVFVGILLYRYVTSGEEDPVADNEGRGHSDTPREPQRGTEQPPVFGDGAFDETDNRR